MDLTIPPHLPGELQSQLQTLIEDLNDELITEKGYIKKRSQILQSASLFRSNTNQTYQSTAQSTLSFSSSPSLPSTRPPTLYSSRPLTMSPARPESQYGVPAIPEIQEMGIIRPTMHAASLQPPSNEPLSAILRHRSKLYERETAFISISPQGKEHVYSWEKLFLKSERVAHELGKLSTAYKLDKVILWYESYQSLEYMAAFSGVVTAGMVAVPVCFNRYTVDEIGEIMEATKAKTVLCSEIVFKKLEQLKLLKTGTFSKMGWVKTDDWSGYSKAKKLSPAYEVPDAMYIEYTRTPLGRLSGVPMSYANLMSQFTSILTYLTSHANISKPVHRNLTSHSPSRYTFMNFVDPTRSTGLIFMLFNIYTGNLMITVPSSTSFSSLVVKYRSNILLTEQLQLKQVAVSYLDKPVKANLSCVKVCLTTTRKVDEEVSTMIGEKWLKNLGSNIAAYVPLLTLNDLGGVVIAMGVGENGAYSECISDATVVIMDPKTKKRSLEDDIGEIWISSKSMIKGFVDMEKVNNAVFKGQVPGFEEDFVRSKLLAKIINKKLVLESLIEDTLKQPALVRLDNGLIARSKESEFARHDVETLCGTVLKCLTSVGEIGGFVWKGRCVLVVESAITMVAVAEKAKQDKMNSQCDDIFQILWVFHKLIPFCVILVPPKSLTRRYLSREIANATVERKFLSGELKSSFVKFAMDPILPQLRYFADSLWAQDTSSTIMRHHRPPQRSGFTAPSTTLPICFMELVQDKIKNQSSNAAYTYQGVNHKDIVISWETLGHMIATHMLKLSESKTPLKNGDKVGILMSNDNITFVASSMACLFLGYNVVVVKNVSSIDSTLKRILVDTQPLLERVKVKTRTKATNMGKLKKKILTIPTRKPLGTLTIEDHNYDCNKLLMLCQSLVETLTLSSTQRLASMEHETVLGFLTTVVLGAYTGAATTLSPHDLSRVAQLKDVLIYEGINAPGFIQNVMQSYRSRPSFDHNAVYSHPKHPFIATRAYLPGTMTLELCPENLRRGKIVSVPSNGIQVSDMGVVSVNTEVVIMHPETCEPQPYDMLGEVWVSSPIVEGTETFQDKQWLRTGDLGFIKNVQNVDDRNNVLDLSLLFVLGSISETVEIMGLQHFVIDLESTVLQTIPESTMCRIGKAAGFTCCIIEIDTKLSLSSLAPLVVGALLDTHSVPVDLVVFVSKVRSYKAIFPDYLRGKLTILETFGVGFGDQHIDFVITANEKLLDV